MTQAARRGRLARVKILADRPGPRPEDAERELRRVRVEAKIEMIRRTRRGSWPGGEGPARPRRDLTTEQLGCSGAGGPGEGAGKAAQGMKGTLQRLVDKFRRAGPPPELRKYVTKARSPRSRGT